MPTASKTKLLTVVIPAYNVGPFVRQCIDSVLSQPQAAAKINVIVVIDGATDNTLDEVHHAVRGRDSFTEIVIQENAGLSGARNTGIARVRTEFVTFLDGDDFWHGGYLSTICPILEDSKPDIVEYNATMVDDQGNALAPLKIACAEEGTSQTTAEEFLSIFRCYAWARVYRTQLVNTRLYPQGRRFEDTATTPWYYWRSHHTISVGNSLIWYRQRAGSILSSPKPGDIDDLIETTSESADMYRSTKSLYWQKVTYRVFQQGCRRAIWQPFRTWRVYAKRLQLAACGVPPPPGPARRLQLYAPQIYLALLYVKSILERS